MRSPDQQGGEPSDAQDEKHSKETAGDVEGHRQLPKTRLEEFNVSPHVALRMVGELRIADKEVEQECDGKHRPVGLNGVMSESPLGVDRLWSIIPCRPPVNPSDHRPNHPETPAAGVSSCTPLWPSLTADPTNHHGRWVTSPWLSAPGRCCHFQQSRCCQMPPAAFRSTSRRSARG